MKNKIDLRRHPFYRTPKDVKRNPPNKICRICHKKFRMLSQHGLCVKCSTNRVKLAHWSIKAKEGPIYEKWKQKIKEGLAKL